MAVIGGSLGFHILSRLGGQGENDPLDASVYDAGSKLELLLGESLWAEIRDRVVIDFGCGQGGDALELARRGATKVIGLDIQPHFLETAREGAAAQGLAGRCHFAASTQERVDVIVSLDAFEHFEDPAAILEVMSTLLKPDGVVLASFGPTWYHPYGGHLFSIFPWSHLLFTEACQIRWRSTFKTDGATRFGEVAGGLNQMSLRRFRKLVAASPFEFEEFTAVPIRKLRWLACPLTREFTTSVVRCKLRLKAPQGASE